MRESIFSIKKTEKKCLAAVTKFINPFYMEPIREPWRFRKQYHFKSIEVIRWTQLTIADNLFHHVCPVIPYSCRDKDEA